MPATNLCQRQITHLLLCILCLAPSAISQDKDTLDTKVTAEGDVVTLSWDSKHPWDAALMAQGVALMAEYKTRSNGVVAQTLQAAKPSGPNTRYIHFRLPPSLTAAPQGGVCLYFQLPNQKLLPVRKAGPQVPDTVRILYKPWETLVVSQSQETSRQSQLAAAKKALDVKTSDVSTLEANIKAKNLTTADACQNIAAPQFSSTQRPNDVVDPPKQEDVARRICTSRIKWADEWLDAQIKKAPKDASDDEKLGFYSEQALDKVLASGDQLASMVRDAKLELTSDRQQQLRQFRADWDHWAPSADTYQPQLGTRSSIDFLELQSIFSEKCNLKNEADNCAKLLTFIANHTLNPLSLPNLPPPTSETVLGYVGGSLEAYSRCVVDDKKELARKYDAWQQIQQRSPELAQAAQAELIASCKQQFTTLDRLRSEKATLQAEVDKLSQPITTTASAIPSGSQTLNSSVCLRPQ
jgi:hypothetical protein